MTTTRRAIRLSDEHWAILQGLSMRLVRESEMPFGARPDAGRVSELFRLVADGTLIVYRPRRDDDAADVLNEHSSNQKSAEHDE